MGFFSRLSSKSSPQEPEATPSAQPILSAEEVLRDSPSSTSAPSFASAGDSAVNSDEKFYDPYAGISAAIKLNNGFRLPEEPEFLFVEDTKKRRSVGENLCYYTGVGYLGGALAGGAYGMGQLMTSKSEVQIESRRVLINRFLNTTGQAGRKSGNALGTLGLFFAAFESGINYFGESYVPAGLDTLGAGFLTGALYRSPRGPLKAAYAGGVGVALSVGLLIGRQFVRGL
ncbi:hypothetical protein BSKO_06173 [Bryopsis sp. KO-2023]|nr:hypothetical protein BSKO_06173 [Bryopsis sp. KO-2023]